jgi:RND family efflux transporter MFP subunit
VRAWSFNRGYAAITAPEDGVVLRKLVQERELVPAGQTVLTLGAHERGFVVRAALADRDIVQFRLGDAAQIRMDAFPGRSFPGTISEIASAADAKTGLFPIEVRLGAPGIALVNGLVAKLELHPSALQGATLTYVPIAAVVEGDRDRASVFVLEGDRARRRVVQVAFIAAESVALAAGVAPGEQVVTDGALYLEDNERVEVVRDAAQPVAGQALPGVFAPAAG